MSGFGTADFFYKEAQQLGYVARSTFKFSFNYGWNLEVQLLQIQKQYKLITPGSSVVDLGCAPGAWLQGGKRARAFLEYISFFDEFYAWFDMRGDRIEEFLMWQALNEVLFYYFVNSWKQGLCGHSTMNLFMCIHL
uniref:rRNA methyltransferase 2, mitochondrial n=1 Tax=Lactuca sativa TaxID=4236 RepID=A0A9R1XA40_LACSA|nr:hypothetical protein LSAT_V11C500261570 [Lactuca sativa]